MEINVIFFFSVSCLVTIDIIRLLFSSHHGMFCLIKMYASYFIFNYC